MVDASLHRLLGNPEKPVDVLINEAEFASIWCGWLNGATTRNPLLPKVRPERSTTEWM